MTIVIQILGFLTIIGILVATCMILLDFFLKRIRLNFTKEIDHAEEYPSFRGEIRQ